MEEYLMSKKPSPMSQGFSPFRDFLGLKFTKIENGCSECELEFNKDLTNPYGTLHGGVIFAMADSGMGTALYSSLAEDEMCSTIETKIVYFKAVKSGTVTCTSKVIHRSKRIAVLESELKQGSRAVAKAIATWSVFKSGKE
jgi:acyl-CoA thioesterase